MRGSVFLMMMPLLLAGCEARFGNDAGEVAENATAAGRAEDGRLTVEAPGFNLSVQIPEGVTSSATQSDNGLIYPGSTMRGVHVQERNGDDGEVELRFTTGDPVDRVAAWYRDPARRSDFTVSSAERAGTGFRLSGSGGDGERFALTVMPRDGGSEARLVLSDRRP